MKKRIKNERPDSNRKLTKGELDEVKGGGSEAPDNGGGSGQTGPIKP